MIFIAVIVASVLAALAIRLFYTRKISTLKTRHSADLRAEFLRAFDAGYASGNVDGQHMIQLENIIAKANQQ